VTREVRYVARGAGQTTHEPSPARPQPPGAELLLVSPRAIYLAYTSDGRLHYAGKVDRRNGGAVAERLREHARSSGRKRRAWRTLWVIPLTGTITGADVAELERTVIRVFVPPGNVQHAKALTRLGTLW
jgi:hypothetical protein